MDHHTQPCSQIFYYWEINERSSLQYYGTNTAVKGFIVEDLGGCDINLFLFCHWQFSDNKLVRFSQVFFQIVVLFVTETGSYFRGALLKHAKD